MLGDILGLFSVGVAIGESAMVTYYISFDQYCKSDCTSYIKEVQRWYVYSNYTKLAATHNKYFHTVNPGAAGQNCLAYS